MSITRHHLSVGLQFVAVMLVVIITTARGAMALTQKDLYNEKIFYFNLMNDSQCSETSLTATGTNPGVAYIDGTPPGSDPEQQIWNFFVYEVHISPAGAAGIMGNIQAESHFDPASEQKPGAWQDMSSQDVNHGGLGGVGLVQWDGGRRPAYINYAKSHGADPKNIVPQLNYIWLELNTNHKATLVGGDANGTHYDGIQNATDPGKAALTFHALYEISADGPSKIQGRMSNAVTILAEYQGKANGDAANTSCSGGSNLSPQCSSATGRARIICAAEQYDPISYREDGEEDSGHGDVAVWHSKYCKTIGPSCYADCSGLVDIAIYDVYGVSLRENTGGERDHIGTNWEKISFDQLQPGDIMQPNPGHVVIIDHVSGNTLYTFAAHSSSYVQDKQVGAGTYTKASGQLYLRYIGSGQGNS